MLNKSIVRIGQVPSDILIDQLSFRVSGNSLVADSTLGGTRIQLVLLKP